MNATKRNYLTMRIDEISRKKESAIHQGAPDKPTIREQYNLIKAGKVKLKSFEDCQRYSGMHNLEDCYSFPKYEARVKEYDKVISKKITALRDEVQRVKDEIMLGDEAKALEMMKAFEKFKA